MKRVTVLVTGSTGQLGQELAALAPSNAIIDWIFTDRSQLDLTDLSELPEKLTALAPDYIINCAAYTAVDKAETESALADTINHKAVGVLAQWCTVNQCKFLHVSTDYVFDGTSNRPLSEAAPTFPINTYGKTKLAGEHACLIANPDAIIVRTSWVYSAYGANFVKTMLRLMGEKETLRIVSDQIGSPTYAADLAEVLVAFILHEDWLSGIYHYSNEGEISWFQFAKAIQTITGSSCKLIGIPTIDYPTPAQRPNYSLLDKGKIKKVLGLTIPDYQTSLVKCIELIQANSTT
jgi:dTDP-4-dehydrorhamnose reductase